MIIRFLSHTILIFLEVKQPVPRLGVAQVSIGLPDTALLGFFVKTKTYTKNELGIISCSHCVADSRDWGLLYRFEGHLTSPQQDPWSFPLCKFPPKFF